MSDTLPHHEGDIVLTFWDVDFYSSLHDCLQNLWTSVIDGCIVFMDEYRAICYCSVFYSEQYWSKYFFSVPPGLVGIGTGIQVSMFYTDPWIKFDPRVLQMPDSVAYCIKATHAIWEYYPEEMDNPTEMDAALQLRTSRLIFTPLG